jgi:phage shock protein PspC (stress-responsive transcriptional regulator)
MTRLHRSRRHRILGGVCGGIAVALGWPPWLARFFFLVLTVLPLFPGAIVYLILWALLPQEPEASLAGERASAPSGTAPSAGRSR